MRHALTIELLTHVRHLLADLAPLRTSRFACNRRRYRRVERIEKYLIERLSR